MRLIALLRPRARPLLTRRRLQVALGLIWLFDGILQFQASMFTPTFYGMMLRMGMAEPPGWLWDLESRLEPLLTAHAATANLAFANLQVLVGIGLFFTRTAKVALALSIPWALGVWLFGEAAGGLFSPGASALTGAPGAALVYAVLALVLWPRRADDERGLVAAGGGLGPWLPDLLWLALWFGTAALESGSLDRMPLVAGASIYNAGNGGPSWLTAANHALGDLVGANGALFAACAGIAQAAVGLGILARRIRTAALVAGIVIALFYGVVGQDLGGIFSNGVFGFLGSGATDPGTAPVVILFALTLWPRRDGLAAIAEPLPPRAAGYLPAAFDDAVAREADESGKALLERAVHTSGGGGALEGADGRQAGGLRRARELTRAHL